VYILNSPKLQNLCFPESSLRALCAYIVSHSFSLFKYFYHYVTTKLWLRSCNCSAPPKKLPWQEEPINLKEKSFQSPLMKQMAITRPSIVLLKICKCYLVQHMILIWMVYDWSCGDKMANHYKNNMAQLWYRRRKMIHHFAITVFYIVGYFLYI